MSSYDKNLRKIDMITKEKLETRSKASINVTKAIIFLKLVL